MHCSKSTGDQIVLEWRVPVSDGFAMISAFEVETVLGDKCHDAWRSIYEGDKFRYVFDQLLSGTCYWFHVRAKNSHAAGKLSPRLSARTCGKKRELDMLGALQLQVTLTDNKQREQEAKEEEEEERRRQADKARTQLKKQTRDRRVAQQFKKKLSVQIASERSDQNENVKMLKRQTRRMDWAHSS